MSLRALYRRHQPDIWFDFCFRECPVGENGTQSDNPVESVTVVAQCMRLVAESVH